jgi:hypothetical protein
MAPRTAHVQLIAEPGKAGDKLRPPTWVEIELVGEDDEPIPGARYRITAPGGTVREGELDEEGRARLDGIAPGACRVTFPELDEDAWEPVPQADGETRS